jgi:hypothetical protein
MSFSPFYSNQKALKTALFGRFPHRGSHRHITWTESPAPDPSHRGDQNPLTIGHATDDQGTPTPAAAKPSASGLAVNEKDPEAIDHSLTAGKCSIESHKSGPEIDSSNPWDATEKPSDNPDNDIFEAKGIDGNHRNRQAQTRVPKDDPHTRDISQA